MNQKVQSTMESDQGKVAAALNTLVEVLVGSEMETVRGRVGTLESDMTERIRSAKGDMTETIDLAVEDLVSRIEALTKKLDEEEQSRTAALTKIKNDVKGDLDNRAVQLEKSLADLTAGLSAVQLELQQQMLATERISGVMNNMATVFSAPAAAPPATNQPTGGDAEENLDNAIDQMFESAGHEMDLEAEPEPFTDK
jgi:hypothetical protein